MFRAHPGQRGGGARLSPEYDEVFRAHPGQRGGGARLSPKYDEVFRAHWWAAVATVARLVGDLEVAEDAVQDACAAALTQWPAAEDPPASPGPG